MRVEHTKSRGRCRLIEGDQVCWDIRNVIEGANLARSAKAGNGWTCAGATTVRESRSVRRRDWPIECG